MEPKAEDTPETPDTEARVEQVRDLIAQGKRNGEIKRTCSQLWGIQPRSVEEYITKARERIREDMGMPRRDLQYEMVSKLETIANDPKVAPLSRLRAFQEINKILGLYQPLGISITPAEASGAQPDASLRLDLTANPKYLDYLRAEAAKEDAEEEGESDDDSDSGGDDGDPCALWEDGDEGTGESGAVA